MHGRHARSSRGSARRRRSAGSSSLFAQFVDMYARPSAKLVPGREPRRSRRPTAPGSQASRPARSVRCRATPTSRRSPTSTASRRCRGSRTSPASPATSRSRARSGRTARARSCDACSRARSGARATSSRSGSSSSTSSSRRTHDGSIEIADPYDTLEKPCYDMAGLTRQYDFLTTVSRYCNELGWGNYANDHEDANGQFEQNFDVRRRARQLRPRDLLPLHGAHARRAARDGRDVHAEAVHAPDRQRLPLPHVALARRRRTCSSTRPTRAGSASRRPRTASSAG